MNNTALQPIGVSQVLAHFIRAYDSAEQAPYPPPNKQKPRQEDVYIKSDTRICSDGVPRQFQIMVLCQYDHVFDMQAPDHGEVAEPDVPGFPETSLIELTEQEREEAEVQAMKQLLPGEDE